MTKRRVEIDIDALSDDLLEDLSVAERRTLTLEAQAAGRDEHVDLLKSKRPTYEYCLPDLMYHLEMRSLQTLALQAMYDFKRCLLNYDRTMTRNRYRAQLVALCETHDIDCELSDLDPLDQPAVWARLLAGYYHGYERFATEDVDVPLETWLAFDEEGPRLVEAAQDVIADYERGPSTEQFVDDALELGTPEDFGDIHYNTLHETWSEFV